MIEVDANFMVPRKEANRKRRRGWGLNILFEGSSSSDLTSFSEIPLPSRAMCNLQETSNLENCEKTDSVV